MELEKLKMEEPLGFQETRETEWVDVSLYKYIRFTSISDVNMSIDIIFSHNRKDVGPTSNISQTKQWSTRKIEILLNYIKIKVTRDSLEENKLLVINVLGKKQFQTIDRSLFIPPPSPKIHSPLLMQSPLKDFIGKVKKKTHEETPDEDPIEPISSGDSFVLHEDNKINNTNNNNNIAETPRTAETRGKSPFRSILKFKSKGKTNEESATKIRQSVSFDRLPHFIPKNAILVGSFSNQIICIPPPENDTDSYLAFKDNKIQWCKMNETTEKRFSWKI